jgi:hypothetical protein
MPMKTNPANIIVEPFGKYDFGLFYFNPVNIRISPWPW